MGDLSEPYEIRDPVHGFVRLNALEWDVINHPVFQRLRRIRQLAWTEMVYPGATHTRFEHSLGVMHVASRMFDTLTRRSGEILRSDYGYDEGGLSRQRRIIRLAALLHDLGHGPFSHAAEELLPLDPDTSTPYEHEDYSAATLQHCMGDLIENHRESSANGIHVKDVLDLFQTPAKAAGAVVWKSLVAGQMDADRMDYLLRDAHHAGVQYGRYDLDRLVNTLRLCLDPETGDHHVGVSEDGLHAVEGLLIARFMMFTQLYFHKTRTIYDYHLVECVRKLLTKTDGVFPPPAEIGNYLEWDDWRVLGLISQGTAGEHGEIIRSREHYRMVFTTGEIVTDVEMSAVEELAQELAPYGCVVRDAEKSWYKSGSEEIRVWRSSGGPERSVALQELSPVVDGLTNVNQRRLYVPARHRQDAEAVVRKKLRKFGGTT